jgi:hypothetical protein
MRAHKWRKRFIVGCFLIVFFGVTPFQARAAVQIFYSYTMAVVDRLATHRFGFGDRDRSDPRPEISVAIKDPTEKTRVYAVIASMKKLEREERRGHAHALTNLYYNLVKFAATCLMKIDELVKCGLRRNIDTQRDKDKMPLKQQPISDTSCFS